MDERERERGNFGKLINGVQGRTEPAIKVEDKDTAVRMNSNTINNYTVGIKGMFMGTLLFPPNYPFPNRKKKKKLETILHIFSTLILNLYVSLILLFSTQFLFFHTFKKKIKKSMTFTGNDLTRLMSIFCTNKFTYSQMLVHF